MNRKEAWEIIKEMETAMVGDKKLDMPAMRTGWTDTDYRSYLWYKPHNKMEIDAVNIYYGLGFETDRIGKWIGVETHLTPDEFDDDDGGYYDNDYEALDIEHAIQNTITFWEALGYMITIK